MNRKKKRGLYSVICVCENDFCTFQKMGKGASNWRISILISKSIKKINIEKLYFLIFTTAWRKKKEKRIIVRLNFVWCLFFFLHCINDDDFILFYRAIKQFSTSLLGTNNNLARTTKNFSLIPSAR